MKIYIPTRGRVHKQTTWDRLSPNLKKETVLVCPVDEVGRHLMMGRPAIVCPYPGIGPTRDYILDMAYSYGQQNILMLDDDIILQRRRADTRITNSTHAEQEETIQWIEAQLNGGWVHACIGTRFLGYASTMEYQAPGRAMYALAYNVPAVVSSGARFCKGFEDFDGMNTMEDFNMTLRLLKMRECNIVSMEHRLTPHATNAEGGCSTWRTAQFASRSARRLAELFPDVVKLRPKKAWVGEGMTELIIMDVTIQWKRALR